MTIAILKQIKAVWYGFIYPQDFVNEKNLQILIWLVQLDVIGLVNGCVPRVPIDQSR